MDNGSGHLSAVRTVVPPMEGGNGRGVSLEEVEGVRAAVLDALSPETRRAYRSQWDLWEQWAEGRGFNPLPAHAAHVALYLFHRSETSKLATVRASRAAISHVHRTKRPDVANPTAHPKVRELMRGLDRRASNVGQRQAAALDADALASIRAKAGDPRRRGSGLESPAQAAARGAVDVAICSVLRDGLLRRSEASALCWGDVEFVRDGSARLEVRRAKSGTGNPVQVAYLGPKAAKALRAIRPANAGQAESVFGLGPAQLSRRVRAAAKAANLEGRFSGHSGRVGMARDLVASGAGIAAVQVAGGWKSARMPAHYARAELAGRGAVALYYAAGGR